MKGLFRRGEHGLVPLDDELPGWKRIKLGDIVDIEYVRPRSQQFHKLFWALLKLVADNQEQYGMDEILDVVKIGVGHTRVIAMPGDFVFRVPKSISFASMDDDSFLDFFNRAVSYIISDIVPFNREALLREVYAMAGIPQFLVDLDKE